MDSKDQPRLVERVTADRAVIAESITVHGNLQVGEQQTTDAVLIAVLDVRSHSWTRDIDVEFSVVNSSRRHCTVTRLSIEVHAVEALENYSVVSAGAPFRPRLYELTLKPVPGAVPITHERFMYKPDGRDDFRLKLSSEPGWRYRLSITAKYAFLDTLGSDVTESMPFETAFPRAA